MPRYDYRCPEHGIFEAHAGLDARQEPCPVCGFTSERRPFSGIPYLNGETTSKNIPEPVYKQHQEGKELRATGWDLDRAVRHLRGGIKETETGGHQFDPQAAEVRADHAARSF